MSKIKIISDLTKKSLTIRKKIESFNLKNPFRKNILIFVIGGDGFMLKTLKKNLNKKNLFYGINSGNYGFLLNKFNKKSLDYKNLKKTKKISISPLIMKATTRDNMIKKSLAINEVSILRQSKQAAKLLVLNNKNIVIKNLVSDGILVSTPAGSTAYNLSVHGPILNLNSKSIAMSPISPFRPRRWKGKIISENSVVKIKNLNLKKRPVRATADNFEVRNVKEVLIKVLKNKKFILLHDQNQSLQKKIKLEQVRKETN